MSDGKARSLAARANAGSSFSSELHVCDPYSLDPVGESDVRAAS